MEDQLIKAIKETLYRPLSEILISKLELEEELYPSSILGSIFRSLDDRLSANIDFEKNRYMFNFYYYRQDKSVRIISEVQEGKEPQEVVSCIIEDLIKKMNMMKETHSLFVEKYEILRDYTKNVVSVFDQRSNSTTIGAKRIRYYTLNGSLAVQFFNIDQDSGCQGSRDLTVSYSFDRYVVYDSYLQYRYVSSLEDVKIIIKSWVKDGDKPHMFR